VQSAISIIDHTPWREREGENSKYFLCNVSTDTDNEGPPRERENPTACTHMWALCVRHTHADVLAKRLEL